MDNELDLWGNINADRGSASSVLTLIQEQATLLETKTSGKVKADFNRITYQYKTERTTMQMMEDMIKSVGALNSVAIPQTKCVEVDEREDLEDASRFYEHGKYKFEIYSEKYKFRLFTLEYQSVFPIKMEIEYGILADKVLTKNVNSVEELKDLLLDIFTSNKVRFIIQKMIELETK